jgi:signal peptidase I
MENTLLIGDHVFVNREQFAPATRWLGPLLPYRTIKRNDVVVFLSPAEPGLYIVKRIVGIPGDRLHVHDGELYRNGVKLDEPYRIHSIGDHQDYRDEFPTVPPRDGGQYTDRQLSLQTHVEGGDIVVPEGSYFGMGDNRDVSLDSRFWGFIPRENVVGRPMFIYWSFETPPYQYEKTGMLDRLTFIGHVGLHFFDATRWTRTFRVVR